MIGSLGADLTYTLAAFNILSSSAFVLMLVACGTTASASVPEHVVRPKATSDDSRFITRSLVLPDGAILAYYVKPGGGPTLVLVPETHGDRTQYYEREFLDHIAPEL